MPLTSATAYGPDLAHVHDVGHGELARRAARDGIRRLRRRGLTSGTIVDLGCGSGIASEAFLRAGFRVVGVDLSPAMLAIARARCAFAGRRATFVRGSFVGTRLPRCVAVVAFGEVLGYAFDEANGSAALERLARRVHEALRPRGLFVFDVLGPGSVGPRRVHRGREGRDWTVAVTLTETAATPSGLATLSRDIVTTRRFEDGRSRQSREVHRVLLFPAALVEGALARAGFVVRRVAGYGGEAFPDTHAAFVAAKAG